MFCISKFIPHIFTIPFGFSVCLPTFTGFLIWFTTRISSYMYICLAIEIYSLLESIRVGNVTEF